MLWIISLMSVPKKVLQRKKCSLQIKPPYYTVQQINDFLNDTFNQRGLKFVLVQIRPGDWLCPWI